MSDPKKAHLYDDLTEGRLLTQYAREAGSIGKDEMHHKEAEAKYAIERAKTAYLDKHGDYFSQESHLALNEQNKALNHEQNTNLRDKLYREFNKNENYSAKKKLSSQFEERDASKPTTVAGIAQRTY